MACNQKFVKFMYELYVLKINNITSNVMGSTKLGIDYYPSYTYSKLKTNLFELWQQFLKLDNAHDL